MSNTNKNALALDLEQILVHTGPVWEELRGQRLFLTGGTGFFGCWLLESLCWVNDHLNLGIQTTVLSRSPESFSRKLPRIAGHPSITWQQGDVKDFDFPAGEFPYVIHAASEGDVKAIQQNQRLQVDTIVTGTQHVLDFAAAHGARKLLFTSSGAVYGRQPPELTLVPEDYPGAPDPMLVPSAYGEAKRAAEMLCRLYAAQYGFETKIARCFAFVGPWLPLDANFAAGNFIRDALNGGPIGIMGDGTPYRSYLYAADLTAWLWTILTRGQSCRPYNVGSDQPLSIADLAQIVAAQFQPKIAVEIRGTPDPFQLRQRYVPDIRRAKKELGLDVWESLETAIQKTIRFHGE